MFVPMIATRVKQLREKKGWSQRELAKRAKLSSCHIEHIESGYIKSPTFATLSKVADALGVSRAKFFAKDDAA